MLSLAYENSFVYIFDVQNGYKHKLITSSTSGSYSPKFYNYDQNIIVGGGWQSGVIDVIDISSGQIVKKLNDFQNYVYSLILTNGGDHLIAGGYDKDLRLYETSDWRLKQTIAMAHKSAISSIVLDNTESFLVTGSSASSQSNNDITIWKVEYK